MVVITVGGKRNAGDAQSGKGGDGYGRDGRAALCGDFAGQLVFHGYKRCFANGVGAVLAAAVHAEQRVFQSCVVVEEVVFKDDVAVLCEADVQVVAAAPGVQLRQGLSVRAVADEVVGVVLRGDAQGLSVLYEVCAADVAIYVFQDELRCHAVCLLWSCAGFFQLAGAVSKKCVLLSKW